VTPRKKSQPKNDLLGEVKRSDFTRETKAERITIRVSESEKEQMQAMASDLGVSLGEYLCILHRLAWDRNQRGDL
jgi:predicted DNA binding CopG/RHH family protein